MVATPQLPRSATPARVITWEKLADDYRLPDDPVDNIKQPLLAEALRDGLESVGLLSETVLTPTNYGICATVNGQMTVKAPDWAYIAQITVPRLQVERSYTPNLEGDVPLVVMEFLSETDGGEYSSKQTHPYGKWFFYEQILQVQNYIIFDDNGGLLEFYRLKGGRYELEQPDENGRHWVREMSLFLGTWQGTRATRGGYWLRWWDGSGTLIPWATERAEQAESEAQQAQEQAQQAQEQAQQAKDKVERLAAYLRTQGIDPETLS